MGTLRKWFEAFLHPEMNFETPHTFLRKIRIFLRKISIFFIKIHKFFPRGTRTPITLIWPRYSFKDPQEVIWSVLPPWNRLWNLMYILKKNKYNLHKNRYIFFKENRDLNHPYYDLYIPLGTLEKVFPCHKKDFGTIRTSSRKISTFFTKKKYVHFFQGWLRPQLPLLWPYIPLGTLGKWFEAFP